MKRALAILACGLSLAFCTQVTPSEEEVATREEAFRPGAPFRECADCPEMLVIPSGSFFMGSPASEPRRRADEGPPREVRIRKFALGKFEVTLAEYEACARDGGCREKTEVNNWGGGTQPVTNMRWTEAVDYVRWLSRKTGQEYRLPSEAEWEYAARAGASTPFPLGPTISSDQANYDGRFSYENGYMGGRQGRYLNRPASTGSYPANGFGLHDMQGNVWEWVADCWHDSYRGAPLDGSAWEGGGDCRFRGLRGGSWVNMPATLRFANREWASARSRQHEFGFRVARTLDR